MRITKDEIRSRAEYNYKDFRESEQFVHAREIHGSRFEGCKFNDLGLINWSFRLCEFINCTFVACQLNGLDFKVCDLSGVHFVNTSFAHEVAFDCCNITGGTLPNMSHRLSSCDISNTTILLGSSITAQAHVQFSKHGERGRTLAAYRLEDGSVIFNCGCFLGDEAKLRRYIDIKYGAAYRNSRLHALQTALELLGYNHANT